MLRVPTPNPPPGIIGHNRTMLAANYCAFPPEGIMDSLLPDWPGVVVRFQTSRQMGARFTQALLILPPGTGSRGTGIGSTGSAGAVDDGVQAFLYVQAGVLSVSVEGATHEVVPGGYVFVPQGVPYSVRNAGEAEARAIWVRKPYQPAAGVAAPTVIVGHRDTALREDSGPRWRFCLLGLRDMPMDFEMNIMCYAPGAHFWCVETHVMEHGMVMLRGQALQLLGRDWHELWEGDFVWMGPYVPQQIYATGSEPCEYLLYKDVNRDVL